MPDDLLVVDLDPRNGGDLDDLVLPETMTVLSGRGDGGMHRYYARPHAPHGIDLHPRPGVDVKINGFMVMPPSLHPDTGKPYTWTGLDNPAHGNRALSPTWCDVQHPHHPGRGRRQLVPAAGPGWPATSPKQPPVVETPP